MMNFCYSEPGTKTYWRDIQSIQYLTSTREHLQDDIPADRSRISGVYAESKKSLRKPVYELTEIIPGSGYLECDGHRVLTLLLDDSETMTFGDHWRGYSPDMMLKEPKKDGRWGMSHFCYRANSLKPHEIAPFYDTDEILGCWVEGTDGTEYFIAGSDVAEQYYDADFPLRADYLSTVRCILKDPIPDFDMLTKDERRARRHKLDILVREMEHEIYYIEDFEAQYDEDWERNYRQSREESYEYGGY